MRNVDSSMATGGIRYRAVALLAGAALALTLAVGGGVAHAYFTTYAQAEGTQTIHLKKQVTIPEEDFSNWTKTVSVSNTGDAPCYVRVKAIAGSLYELTYTDGAGAWNPAEDGYYYCSTLVQPGESTPALKVKISLPDTKEGDLPQDFNVTVVEESVPALYNTDGTPYADWTLEANKASESYNAGGEQ